MTAPKRSTEEQNEHILTQLGQEKRSLSAICREDWGMPSLTGFLTRVSKDADLAERYSRAREAQVTGLLEDCLVVAEEATDDVYITTDSKGKKVAKVNGRVLRRAQLIIETRERFAKMMMPERFAQQRMDVTSGGKALPAPVQVNDNRIQALISLAAHRASQLADPVPLIEGEIVDPMNQ